MPRRGFDNFDAQEYTNAVDGTTYSIVSDEKGDVSLTKKKPDAAAPAPEAAEGAKGGLSQWTASADARVLTPLEKCSVAGFACALAASTLTLWCFCVALRSALGRALVPRARAREALALRCASVLWRAALFACPWIRLVDDGSAGAACGAAGAPAPSVRDAARAMLDEAAAAGDARPLMILGNHVSFLDTVVFVAFLPAAAQTRIRCLGDARLYGLDVLR